MRRLVTASLVASVASAASVAAVASVAACTAAAPPASAPKASPESGPARRDRPDDPPTVDPIAALAPADGEQVSWLVPGRIQLDLGAGPIEAPGDERALEVAVIDRRGDLVRAAVRLDHARFSVWAERASLLAVLAADHRVAPGAGPATAREIGATLRAGARVRRLARKDGATHVRYVGALQVEGWIPDGRLAEHAPRRDPPARVAAGRRMLHVTPGTVLRAEPRWASPAVATVADGYFLDIVRELDPPWFEVAYADGDVLARGFVSKRDPPGTVHRPRGPAVPPPAVVPNGKIRDGTCLHASARGEEIGYVVGDRDAAVEAAGPGWWSVAIDTPWGPIAFAARGPAPDALAPCAR